MASSFAPSIVYVVAACALGLLLLSLKPFAESGKMIRVTFHSIASRDHSGKLHSKPQRSDILPKDAGIPRILHHVYLDGLDSLQLAESLEGPKPGQQWPGYNSSWRQSCQIVHPTWQYMFWNSSQAETLIRNSFPGFLSTYLSYNNIVQKGELLRIAHT